MHATKALGAPEVDAAEIIKAQLQLFRRQAGAAGIGRLPRLPPITEAACGHDEDCGDGCDTAAVRRCGVPRSRRPAPGCHGGGKRGGAAKSDCVKRIEELQRQRDARRQHAAEAKVQRAAAVEEAQAMGGIRSVEFLQKIKAWRSRHRLAERPLPWVDGPDVWAQGDGSGIRVCVRKRPMLQAELRAHDFDVVSIGPGPARLTVHEPRTRVDLCKEIESHGFGVDAIFSEADGNDAIYRATLAPLLPHVLAGGSATVFAFGQTGSGKSATLGRLQPSPASPSHPGPKLTP